MNKLIKDRRTLYFVLSIMIISVFTLSVAYAAMSTVLEIRGNSEVVASNWDIHLENAILKEGSVRGSSNGPDISGDNYVHFNVEMSTPGDFFEFTVDVVNAGTIDAMIDDIIKTPELTSEQAKYIKYDVSYENGESISTRQTLRKGTITPIKVRVEFRKDINASDLSSTRTELNLGLKLVYVQSDGSGSSIPDNGQLLVKVVSGDGTQVGNEVCIKEECFYVISSTDTTVTMLAKYNLYVGGEYNNVWIEYGTDATGIQNSEMLGYTSGQSIRKGTSMFSSTNYWMNTVNDYPTYIYNSNSILYTYVDNYKLYLISLGITPIESRIINYEELLSLGCSLENRSCIEAPSWVYATSYWTGVAYDSDIIWYISTSSNLDNNFYNYSGRFGVRPVIVISRDYL